MTEQTPEPGGRRGGYLPVLPDGWEYHIQVLRTDDVDANIAIQSGDEGKWNLHIYASAARRSLSRASLPEALRAAVDAVKALDRLRRTEDEFRAAREAALASLGDEDDVVDATIEDDVPQVEPPAAAGSLAKDGEG